MQSVERQRRRRSEPTPAPQAARVRLRLGEGTLFTAWGVTRGLLLLGLLISHQFTDVEFYHYAALFATGHLPYHDVLVEYPPLAMLLVLLPALPLLPFAALAPRPLGAFSGALTHLPVLTSPRYAAYGISFAIEMLLIDLLTLWLVRKIASALLPHDPAGVRSGLLYVFLVFASGALLQKFDLAAGTLCLAAVYAVLRRRPSLAFACVALATLVKGFPLLMVPLLCVYLVQQGSGSRLWDRLRSARRALLAGAGAFAAVLAISTGAVLVWAGRDAVVHTVAYHAGRGLEIESLYATVVLLAGWLPGLAATTAFSADELSRVVHSALARPLNAASVPIAACFILAVGGVACWRGIGGLRMAATADSSNAASTVRAVSGQALITGSAAVFLAFMIGFRALPSHYVLPVLPLAALVRLPSRFWTRLWFGALVGLAIIGQVLVGIWHLLVALSPWGVAVLTLRNLCWMLAFVVAVVGLWSLYAARTSVDERGRAGVRTGTRARRWRRVWFGAVPTVPGFAPRREDVVAYLFSRVAPEVLIFGAGLVSLLVYGALVLAFPLTYWYSHPHQGISSSAINDIGRITNYSPVAAFAFVAAVLVLFACQFLALVGAGRVRQMRVGASRADNLARVGVLLFPVLFVVVMIWMQPVTTTDLYGYVARGYLYAHLHLNPMITGATQLPGGQSVDRPAAPYGPAWLLIAGVVARFGGENLLANMLAFKCIAAAGVLGAAVLVDWLGRRLYPERRLRIYVLFSWSPLLLFEAVGNGHNDIIMMLCVLAAFALMLKGRARTAFALLVLGALVKYFCAIFVLFWLVYELRRRTIAQPAAVAPESAQPDIEGGAIGEALVASVAPRRMSAAMLNRARAAQRTFGELDQRAIISLLASVTLIGGALVVAFYAPFWVGIKTFTGLGQQLRPLYYNSSLIGFFTAPLKLLVPVSEFPALDKTVRFVVYVLFGSYAFIQARRLWLLGTTANIRDVITVSAKITFAALILITFWFQPWYIVWLLPLGALAGEPFVRRQGPIFAVGALMTYAISNFLLVDAQGLARDLFVQFFTILIVFVPLLLLRASPYQHGWVGVARRYAGGLTGAVNARPIASERVMLALVLFVAAGLRLVLLGNLFQTLPTGGAGSDALKEVGADLRLYLSDPQGLHGPFGVVQAFLVRVFGSTPLAALLPSAVIGTATVFVLYLLTQEIMRQGWGRGTRIVPLLAALLAATSEWHLSLSRSGMEVVLLPLLTCLAVYWLLLALRLGAPGSPTQPREQTRVLHPRRRHRRHGRQRAQRTAALRAAPETDAGTDTGEAGRRVSRRCALLCVGCGICTGLACDLAPGLWLLPLLVVGFLVVWRWRMPEWFGALGGRLALLAAAALVTGLPAFGYFVSQWIGFPKGSPILARSSVAVKPGPSLFSAPFWGTVAANAGGVLRVFATQDYSAGYPAVGRSPIIPVVLSPFFFLGLVLLLSRWRRPTSLALLLLVALPLVASVAVGTPTGVIEAASILPATCIIPALALYETAVFFGHLPIVLDRINGARIFTTPEQIGRVLLLVFLLVSVIRTFFWYFEATLPSQPPDSTSSLPYLAPSSTMASTLYTHGVTVVDSPVGGTQGGVLPIPPSAGIVHVLFVG